MSKLVLIILATALTGCASVKVPQAKIDKIIADTPVAKTVVQPLMAPSPPPPVYPVAAMPSPITVAEVVIMPEPAPVIPAPPPKKKMSKTMTVAKKVVESLVAKAAAATKGEVTTTIYDDAGKVKSKTVVENDESVLADLVKLVALLTGTLGLFVGWRNYRKPAVVAQKA
jgi:hypothetical protein